MKESAGLLLYQLRADRVEVLLVHPGGPFWRHKDVAAWSIPKGEISDGESAIDAARREFAEELGQRPPESTFASLGTARQAGGKLVHAWAVEGAFDVTGLRSTSFELEWPPRSGKTQSFPEVDRAAWFDLEAAHRMILAGQRTFIERLEASLKEDRS